MSDLEGLLVVSLEQAVAAPYASCKLADAGARVVKVERPEGDFARGYDSLVEGQSAYFVWLNRGKESVALDLKSEPDRAVLQAIIAEADVFIQNFAPGAVDRLGLGAAELCALHPRLIYCSISGYGDAGPYRDQKAYDLLVQAESGLLSINGTAEASARVGISVCDITAGLTAYAAILQSLVRRGRTGEGRHIEVSLFHAIADWMNVPYLQTRYGHKPPQRVGLRHPTIAPYGAFTCGDGKQVLLAIQNEREWARFCTDVLREPSVQTDERFATNIVRVANVEALEAAVSAVLGTMTREQAIERLSAGGIAYGRLSSLDDLVHHPQNHRITVRTDGGEIELLAPGARFAGELPVHYGPVPAIGEHTEALRREFAAPGSAEAGRKHVAAGE
jgi:crotonobetainyl-CoA:carnitine CoA-transferase CaiB-like acyl-CoA transferase